MHTLLQSGHVKYTKQKGDGVMSKPEGAKVFCPVNGWDCPYFKEGECKIENPIEECDDFAFFWDADEEYWADN